MPLKFYLQTKEFLDICFTVFRPSRNWSVWRRLLKTRAYSGHAGFCRVCRFKQTEL